MAENGAHNPGVVAAAGGAGAAIGASAVTVVETDPLLGLVLAVSAGLVVSGGLAVLYSHRS